MNKISTYAIFGILFLGATLLASGMYSSQIFAFEENGNAHDQNGNLNEAEINADIEQENKCKKDTECENENEINNLLNITTITTTGAANGNGNGNGNLPPEGTCLFCFEATTSDNPKGPWPPGKLTQFVEFIEDPANTVPFLGDSDVNSVQEICDAIDAAQQPIDYDAIATLIDDSLNGNDDQLISQVVQCLRDAGYDITSPP